MNQGPEGFNYLSVTILNPYINERLNHKNKHRELTTISQRSHAEDLPDAIIMKDHAFQKREWVSFFIDPKISRNLNNACLTVVPKGAMKCQYHNENEGRSMPEGKFRYMPELNGMTLSGRVTGKNNASVSYARVYFTSLGPDRNFYCAITDSSGGFQFSLPDQTGKVEIFGSAEHQEIDELNLRIDQNFTNEFIALPYLVLQDDSAILDVYNKLSVNAQIAEQFKSDLKENNGIHSTGKDRDSVRVYFYGRPSKVILIENFIKLPTLEDYFNEVIPEVAIRKRNNKKKFVIHGNNAELNLFDPLVMIDGVAIFDIDAVLKISPRHIVRVEVITEPYIRGNVVFGGIINIISKEDNFGYVELPSSGLLFEFKMFSYNGQSGIIRNGITRHIPDVRNTLYWKGNLVLTDSSAHHFQANDVSGVYEIMLMGFTKNGEYIESTETFSVE
ncbi:MAG: carboxypeptidase-like regulatory domain-containing protein [Bacteroidales bacterium]|nr:carboxypeptidase-like regulatory domain-containing protein [Bacteroidales bacterium]